MATPRRPTVIRVALAPRPSLVAASRLAALVVCGVAGGCAHRAGTRAASGAVESLQEQSREVKERTGEYPAERLGSRVTQGALGALSDPQATEQLQELAARIAEAAAQRAVTAVLTPGEGGVGAGSPLEVASTQIARAVQRELTRALAADLGPNGEGPLGRALAGTSAEVSLAATRALLLAAFPECGPGEPRCLDRRVGEMAQEAAAGAVRGFSRAVAWMLIAGSFLAGVIAALLLIVTFRLVRRRPAPALVERSV